MQNVSALLWHFFSGMPRPVVLAAKVHRPERLLQRATQEARQACVESNDKMAQTAASWLSTRRPLSAPEHAAGCPKLWPISHGPSAAWSALAGHTGLVFELAALLSGAMAVSGEKS